MAGRKDHKIEIIMSGFRWTASELSGKITLMRDGGVIGKALWDHDHSQLVHSTATMPDDVVFTIEKLLKEQMDKNWEED
jgi:hypothetical protein